MVDDDNGGKIGRWELLGMGTFKLVYGSLVHHLDMSLVKLDMKASHILTLNFKPKNSSKQSLSIGRKAYHLYSEHFSQNQRSPRDLRELLSKAWTCSAHRI